MYIRRHQVCNSLQRFIVAFESIPNLGMEIFDFQSWKWYLIKQQITALKIAMQIKTFPKVFVLIYLLLP